MTTPPIGGPSLPQPTPPHVEPSVPQVAQQMQTHALDLADQLEKLTQDPSLSVQAPFLQDIAGSASHLNHALVDASKIR